MVVDFAREIGVIFPSRLQNNLVDVINLPCMPLATRAPYLGAIGELVRSQIHFPERSLADKTAERVIADIAKLIAREFPGGH